MKMKSRLENCVYVWGPMASQRKHFITSRKSWWIIATIGVGFLLDTHTDGAVNAVLLRVWTQGGKKIRFSLSELVGKNKQKQKMSSLLLSVYEKRPVNYFSFILTKTVSIQLSVSPFFLCLIENANILAKFVKGPLSTKGRYCLPIPQRIFLSMSTSYISR